MAKAAQRRRHTWSIIAGSLASLLLACGTQVLMGQGAPDWFEVPVDKSLLTDPDPMTGEQKVDDRKLKQLVLIKKQVLLGSAGVTENTPNLDRLYKGYVFPSFSHVSQLSSLPAKRKEIVSDLALTRSRDMHKYLLDLTRFYMEGYVKSPRNFHPAVRYNAILLLGELNQDEVVPPQRFPNPLPEALTYLVAQYNKPDQSDAIRLACMLGILRHAQLDWARPEANRIPEAQRQEITKMMLTLVTTKDPPPESTPEGHVWMQRRALEILGALGVVGPVDSVNKAVTDLIRDPSADLFLRCTAAATMSRVNNRANRKVNLDPAIEALHMGALLVQACNAELARMENLQKESRRAANQGGSSGMSGMPGMSGMSMPGMSMPGMSMPGMMPGMAGEMPGGDPSDPSMFSEEESGDGMAGMGMMMSQGGGAKDPQVDLFRRRLKQEVVWIRDGINGVSRLNAANPQANKTITDAVLKVLKATDPPATSSTLAGLHKSIKEGLKDLEKLTAGVMPKPKPKPAAVPASDEPDAPVAPDAPGIPGVPAAPGAASDAADPSAPPAAPAKPAPANRGAKKGGPAPAGAAPAPARGAVPAPAAPGNGVNPGNGADPAPNGGQAAAAANP